MVHEGHLHLNSSGLALTIERNEFAQPGFVQVGNGPKCHAVSVPILHVIAMARDCRPRGWCIRRPSKQIDHVLVASIDYRCCARSSKYSNRPPRSGKPSTVRTARLSALHGLGRRRSCVGHCRRCPPIKLLGQTTGSGGFQFVQISESHIGFNKPANADVNATLQLAIDKIDALPKTPPNSLFIRAI